MPCCITADQLLTFDPCLAHEICATPARIESSLCASIEKIERILGISFCPDEEQCKTFSGNGTNLLLLQEKIVSITSISYTDCDQCGTPENLPRIVGSSLVFDCCDNNFPCGDYNITVCGFWGEPPKQSLIDAAIQMSLESLLPGCTGLSRVNTGVESISWGDVSVSYSSLSDRTGSTTGFTAIDDCLELFLDSDNQIIYSVVSECHDCNDCETCLGDRVADHDRHKLSSKIKYNSHHNSHHDGNHGCGCNSNCGCDKC